MSGLGRNTQNFSQRLLLTAWRALKKMCTAFVHIANMTQSQTRVPGQNHREGVEDHRKMVQGLNPLEGGEGHREKVLLEIMVVVTNHVLLEDDQERRVQEGGATTMNPILLVVKFLGRQEKIIQISQSVGSTRRGLRVSSLHHKIKFPKTIPKMQEMEGVKEIKAEVVGETEEDLQGAKEALEAEGEEVTVLDLLMTAWHPVLQA